MKVPPAAHTANERLAICAPFLGAIIDSHTDLIQLSGRERVTVEGGGGGGGEEILIAAAEGRGEGRPRLCQQVVRRVEVAAELCEQAISEQFIHR